MYYENNSYLYWFIQSFSLGHLNILEKTKRIFGEENVIIAIGRNPSKGDQDLSDVIRVCRGFRKDVTQQKYLLEKIESLEWIN